MEAARGQGLLGLLAGGREAQMVGLQCLAAAVGGRGSARSGEVRLARGQKTVSLEEVTWWQAGVVG